MNLGWLIVGAWVSSCAVSSCCQPWRQMVGWHPVSVVVEFSAAAGLLLLGLGVLG